MADWAIALIGVGGTAVGALISSWTSRLSAAREDARRREERQWSEKRAVYEGLLQWISTTDTRLHDIHYSYRQYREHGVMVPSVDTSIPEIVAVKQAEYRDILPPDQWALPDLLQESTKIHLAIFASLAIMRDADVAERASIRVADEAMSAGRFAVEGAAAREDAGRSDDVIDNSYRSWLAATNRLQNSIRNELAPGSEHVPVDENRFPNRQTLG
jgi:hypothetical protein